MYSGRYSILAKDFHDSDSVSDAMDNNPEIEYLMNNPPVFPAPSPNPTSPSLIPGKSPLDYSKRCLEYTFNNQASDEQRAKSFIQLFEDCTDTLLQHIDRASFDSMMARFAEMSCFQSHAAPCTLPHAEPYTLPHLPHATHASPQTSKPAHTAIPIPCPLSHNDPCMKEHTTDEENMRQCEATALTIMTLTESLRKAEMTCIPISENLNRERDDHRCTKQLLNQQIISLTLENTQLKKKVMPKKRNTSKVPILGANEIRPYDMDGYFFSDIEDSVKVLYPTVPPSPTSNQMDIDTKEDLIIPPSPVVSLQKRDLVTPPSHSPALSLPKQDFLTRKDNKSFQIRENQAMSAPVNHTQQCEPALPRAQTAPPLLSCNTLTARRCTSKGPTPSSYVKFLDVPYLSQERYMEMLKENTKWSMAKVSRIETFGMKTAQGNWNIKICFKDNTQLTLVKKLFTTSVTFDTVTQRCHPWYLQTRPSTQHA
ncbi:hypothetical protein M378DRAFT_15717 [Amanita muscaria Koide BX008]|uniref:Uncharacterized protein n=1 Tax=Amanita muscaria (strain Koide BX008) TaxID=946122 RepID=A0A0C2SVU2_AMAMK|nr:hypothetical protein M378DRAFT_15717 [Amanita muscaria Koide BX008]